MHDIDGRTDDPATTRVARWERRSEWPMALAAVVFLAAFAWPILDPHLSHGWHRTCDAVDTAVWVIFGIDYVVRVVLAQHRVDYVRHHLIDLAVLALPILRPLRLLRLVVLLEVLNRRAADSLRGRIAVYVGGATVLLLLCASLAVLDAERGRPGSNIHNFGDALWWAVTTMSTVGYGDRFPVTGTGRFVAAGLMLGGIALLSVVTASIASWLIERVQEAEHTAQAATRADVQRLTDEVRELRAMLTANGLAAAPQQAADFP